MKIIGIAGTNGSGKDTVGHILSKDHGYLFVSITDILREELAKEGKTTERENMRELSARWRRESGLGVLVDKAIEIFKSKGNGYKGLAISSIRNIGEVDHIHKLDGTMLWADAEPHIRYERVSGRKRSSEDMKTYEEFLQEEADEMKSSGDETSLAMAEVKKLCDVFIENNSDDIQILKAIVENTLRGKNIILS